MTIGHWLKGLIAAGITGAAGGLSTALSAVAIAPETFNTAGGLASLLKLAGVSAIVSAITGVAAYLKQSPLPPEGP